MTRLLLLIVLSLTIFSCKNDSVQRQQESVEAKKLQLKEKELPKETIDTTQFTVEQQTANTNTTNTEKSQDRKLRFMYYSNTGLRAYFNDGSVIVCSRCDLTKENIERIQSNTDDKSIQTYAIEKDGSLLIDGWKHEYPVVNKNENYEGWAMINYKWYVKY